MKEWVCRSQDASTDLLAGSSLAIVEIQAGMPEIKLSVSEFGMTLPLSLISVREMFKLISWFVILLFVLELFLVSYLNQFSCFLYSSLLVYFLVLTHV